MKGMNEKEIADLIRKAMDMRSRAYAPYSGFTVGAALMCTDGTIYTGTNIENAAYGVTMCAERTAVFKAVSEGKKSFSAIAIIGGKAAADKLAICPPCGECRQVLREFCTNRFVVILATSVSDYELHTLGELLPLSFDADKL